jgi:hypothetical protein
VAGMIRCLAITRYIVLKYIIYNCSVQDIIDGAASTRVHNYVINFSEGFQLETAGFISELVLLRDELELSNGVVFSREELDKLLFALCTSVCFLLFVCIFVHFV